jgi:hypothetical protein
MPRAKTYEAGSPRATHRQRVNRILAWVRNNSKDRSPEYREGMARLLQQLPVLMGWNATSFKTCAECASEITFDR